MKILILLLLVASSIASSVDNQFVSSLYKEVANENQVNFVISPASLAIALNLLHLGSQGPTAQELESHLKLPNSQEANQNEIINLLNGLQSDEKLKLNVVNKIYVKNGFSLKESFKTVAQQVFKSELENIDFVGNQEAASRINQWVELQTEKKIKNLINPQLLDQYTRAVLINAIYFKGNFSIPFYKRATKLKDFHRNSNDIIQVPTLQRVDSYGYLESLELGAKVLEIRFEGPEAFLGIVLPDEVQVLGELENKLDILFRLPKIDEKKVNVSLPKFRVETALQLKSVLQKLGINKIFLEDQADLSLIAGDPGDLLVNDVLQKTFIDVEERGVEAAGASAVLVAVPISAVPIDRRPIHQFVVDRPFLFYVKVNDAILFIGHVNDPQRHS